MNKFSQLALSLVLAPSFAFATKPVATVTSAEPFTLDGSSITTPGVTSFPVIVGDTVSTQKGSAVLMFPDGSTLKLASNSSVRITGTDGEPKVVLVSGSLDYKLVPGSGLSVTNLDREHTSPQKTDKADPRTLADARTLPGGGRLVAASRRPAPQATPAQSGAAPGSSNSAVYAGSDILTGGSWAGKYGADGQLIPKEANNPPSYANVRLSGDTSTVWAAESSDPRALQTSSNSSSRIASSYAGNSFTIDLNLTDGNAHKISLYLCDFDSAGRTETIAIVDADSKAILNTQTFSSFVGGVYALWNLKGHVQIQVVGSGGKDAVVNGIFFDVPGAMAAPGGSSGAGSTPTAHGGLLTSPKFLIPVAGAAAAGLAAGLLSLPPVSRRL